MTRGTDHPFSERVESRSLQRQGQSLSFVREPDVQPDLHPMIFWVGLGLGHDRSRSTSTLPTRPNNEVNKGSCPFIAWSCELILADLDNGIVRRGGRGFTLKR